MGRVVFVTGGTRSGKSAIALSRAGELPGRKAYVATAQAYDGEMAERIRMHKRERGPEWETYEEPVHLGMRVREVSANHEVIIIDCLTIWLSNLLCGADDVEREEGDLLDSLRALDSRVHLFIVSNEVGMGIVPENELARKFRDVAGKLNQQVAQIADEAFFVVAGLPMKIK
jgi:adenosylcobinamide kinase/adenosylcobinamide-phosphate guanylyltransferase